jgi:hypothetical protein
MNKNLIKSLVATALLSAGVASAATITNGSFETGDFSGWIAQDLPMPFSPLTVTGSGANTFGWSWSSTPTDGSYTAFSGFDGSGPGTISIAQNIGIVGDSSTLTFDYRAAWNLRDFCSGCSGRQFNVDVFSAVSSTLLGSFNFISAAPGSYQDDTGALTGSVDMSAFSGQDVRISFDLVVPDSFSGPAQFQLDNVALSNNVPEPFSLALFGIGAVGFGMARRRKQ